MRGFTNIFRKEFSVVNLDKLAMFPENTKVTPQLMVESGLIKSRRKPVKILGRGELNVALAVEANRFSQSARQSIEAAGGSAMEIG